MELWAKPKWHMQETGCYREKIVQGIVICTASATGTWHIWMLWDHYFDHLDYLRPLWVQYWHGVGWALPMQCTATGKTIASLLYMCRTCMENDPFDKLTSNILKDDYKCMVGFSYELPYSITNPQGHGSELLQWQWTTSTHHDSQTSHLNLFIFRISSLL